MAVTVSPYELFVRFKKDGTVAGASVRNLTTIDGKDFEGEPEALASTSDEAFTAFAEQFSASVVAERDSLAAQVQTLTSQKAALQAQLDALTGTSSNPRHVAPFVFLSLLKPEEIVAMQTSSDPVVLIGRAKLQTIITYVDLDNTETQQLVGYMEQIGIIAAGRAARILSNQLPE